MKRLAWIVLAACHHGPAVSTPPPATCEQAADRLLGFMAEGPAESKAAIRTVMVDHCKSDSWSEGARGCIAGSANADELGRCDAKLTDAQRDSMAKAAEELANKLHGQADAGPGGGGGAPPTTEAPPMQPAPAPPPADPKKPKPKGSGRSSGDPCEGGQ